MTRSRPALLTLLALCLPVAAAAADAPATPASAPASAPAAAPASAPAAPDMSKMGPWSRKTKNEAAIKREIADFFKAEAEVMKKGDLEAAAARCDFPLFMATDDATGKTESALWDKAAYLNMMKGFADSMPKESKMTHKPVVKVLSDNMVVFTDDFTMTVGKTKLTGSNAGMLVKIGGAWKWKSMIEAGWGGTPDAAKP